MRDSEEGGERERRDRQKRKGVSLYIRRKRDRESEAVRAMITPTAESVMLPCHHGDVPTSWVAHHTKHLAEAKPGNLIDAMSLINVPYQEERFFFLQNGCDCEDDCPDCCPKGKRELHIALRENPTSEMHSRSLS